MRSGFRSRGRGRGTDSDWVGGSDGVRVGGSGGAGGCEWVAGAARFARPLLVRSCRPVFWGCRVCVIAARFARPLLVGSWRLVLRLAWGKRVPGFACHWRLRCCRADLMAAAAAAVAVADPDPDPDPVAVRPFGGAGL